MQDPNRTQIGAPPVFDPNRTVMGPKPTVEATQTIKPVQCPVCKTFNPVGVMFCVECGLIFDRALPADAFGAAAVQLPTLLEQGGREHPLRPGQTVLGRTGDIALEDPRISRRHAQVDLQGGVATFQDMGSTNGSKVNGEPVAQGVAVTLQAGDVVSLGGLELTFGMPGEANKTAMPVDGKTQMGDAPSVHVDAAAWLGFAGQEWPLTQGKLTFGRRSSNQIVLSNPYVSGAHGEFEVTDEGVFVTDLGSTNGTFVNDAKLEPNRPTKLAQGDTLRLGDAGLELRWKESGS